MERKAKRPKKYNKSISSQELPGQQYLTSDFSDSYFLEINEHIESAIEYLCHDLNCRDKTSITQKEAPQNENDLAENSINESFDDLLKLDKQVTSDKKRRNKHTYNSTLKKLELAASQINNNEINTNLLGKLQAELLLETCKKTRINNSYIFLQYHIAMAIAQNQNLKHNAAWKAIVMVSYYQGLYSGLTDINSEGLTKRASAGGHAKAEQHPATTPAKIKAEGIAAGIMLSRMPISGWSSYSEAAQETIEDVLKTSDSLKLKLPEDKRDLEGLLINLAAEYNMTSKRDH